MDDQEIPFDEGQDLAPMLKSHPDCRQMIVNELVDGFNKGEIELTKPLDPVELKNYSNGLLTNWVRKDKRLNGNVKYHITEPGSRTSSADVVMKQLKKVLRILLVNNTDPLEIELLKNLIKRRSEEVRKKKVVKENIDIDHIPEHLKHLITFSDKV